MYVSFLNSKKMSYHSNVFATVRRHCCCSTAGCADNLESQAPTAFKNPLKHSIHRNTAALIQVLFNVMYYMSADSSMSLQAVERDPLLENSWSL